MAYCSSFTGHSPRMAISSFNLGGRCIGNAAEAAKKLTHQINALDEADRTMVSVPHHDARMAIQSYRFRKPLRDNSLELPEQLFQLFGFYRFQ
jgi:hypothetical protein